MRVLAVVLVLFGSGTLLQKAGDRYFERKGDGTSLPGRLAMVLGLVVLWGSWILKGLR